MAATLTIIDKVSCSLFLFDPITKELITPIIELDGSSTFVSSFQDQGKHLYQGINNTACLQKITDDTLTNPFA